MRIGLILLGALMLTGCTATGAAETAPPVETTAPQQVTAEAAVLVPEGEETVDPIAQRVENMTLPEKVGQMFLVRCPEENAAAACGEYGLGGYLLFGRDFEQETPDTLREKLAVFQANAAIPMVIAVDEEGGTVCRVSSYCAFRDSRFASPRTLYASGGMEAVLAAEAEKAALLHSLGIQVNMAPVCDVTMDPNAFLYDRSLGEAPETVAQFALRASQIMAQYQVGSVLKHFPGYGSNADTHVGMAVDERTLDELENYDLIPFREGIAGGCGAILVSHTVVNCLDDALPASLSPAVHSYLRETMGFDGVIITDALDMDAIELAYGSEEAAVLAVLAGNDILCTEDYAAQIPALINAVASGRISEMQVDAAVTRVLRWKESLGLPI